MRWERKRPAQPQWSERAEQDRSDVAAKHRRWRSWQRFMDPVRYVFLDETGTATKMARRYGRSPSGEGLVAAGRTVTGARRRTSPASGARE